MLARAHLKLIVSEPVTDIPEDAGQDRMSMVQPISVMRVRLHWLRAHGALVALWSTSAVLLSVAGLVALGWW